jgi:hypothetical protein
MIQGKYVVAKMMSASLKFNDATSDCVIYFLNSVWHVILVLRTDVQQTAESKTNLKSDAMETNKHANRTQVSSCMIVTTNCHDIDHNDTTKILLSTNISPAYVIGFSYLVYYTNLLHETISAALTVSYIM